MKRYVVGFAFDERGENILMIKKSHPAWQEGKLNGIGGHIKDGEKSIDAMDRESREEAGLGGLAWLLKATVTGDDWHLDVYAAFTHEIFMAHQNSPEASDEPTVIRHWRVIRDDEVLADVQALIAFARDSSSIIKPVNLFSNS